jgi:acetyltransferase-like isoleucine patch superfamily enzyme
MMMSSTEEWPKRPLKRPLLVVIPASSGDAAADLSPAYLRPIMGRPLLAYLLDAALTLAPDGIIVFAEGADEKTLRDIRILMPHRGSAVAETGDPTALFNLIMKNLQGHPADVLFISATAAPLTGEFLSDFIDDYRLHPGVPCRAVSAGANGERRTRLLLTDASHLAGINVSSDDSDGSFADRVFRLLDREAVNGGARDFAGTSSRLPGDVTHPRDFAAMMRIVRGAVVERLMDGGVTIIDPERTYVDWGVTVGRGTTLFPDTYLEGVTILGKDCVIEPNVKITDSTLADAVTVKMCSVITESAVEHGAQIGPFAHLRPKTHLGKGVKIGNFVEVKKSTIGQGSKASHLSYLGDAQLGKDVNVGAGTITCNYDGINKHTTTIGDGVFIGSDTQFIAPVTVGDNSLIGAGSTITKDIPPDSLAVARSKQVTIPGRGVKSRKKHI